MSLKSHVHPGDVVAAVKTLFGPTATLLDYEVSKCTENVQGFMSTILRVCATCLVGEEQKVAKFIVKRLPIWKVQQAMASDSKQFGQEIAFFTKCLPLMRKRCPDLKVVDCLFAHSASTIVLEDLAEKGFRTLADSYEELKVLDIPLEFSRLLMRELAKFHVSSQGINWLKMMPELFEKDIVFEVGGGVNIKHILSTSLNNSVFPIMEHIYKDDLNYIKKYIDWLSQFEEHVVPLLIQLFKPNPRYMNTLCHGDCWVNNFMVRYDDPSVMTSPSELKIIDLQAMRYGSVYSDLQYFIYLGTKTTYRRAHLETLLRTYVESFNAVANVTPDPLNWEQFRQGFEETRLEGALLATCLKPVAFTCDISLSDGREMSEENFQAFFGTSDKTCEERKLQAVQAYENVPCFGDNFRDLINELLEEMDDRIFQKNSNV